MAKGHKTGGRRRGSQNHLTRSVKDAVLRAFEAVGGGACYLEKVAREDPKTFVALLGRVIPHQIEGTEGAPVVIQVVTGVPRALEWDDRQHGL